MNGCSTSTLESSWRWCSSASLTLVFSPTPKSTPLPSTLTTPAPSTFPTGKKYPLILHHRVLCSYLGDICKRNFHFQEIATDPKPCKPNCNWQPNGNNLLTIDSFVLKILDFSLPHCNNRPLSRHTRHNQPGTDANLRLPGAGRAEINRRNHRCSFGHPSRCCLYWLGGYWIRRGLVLGE